MDYHTINKCLLCDAEDFEKEIISFDKTPLANEFVSKPQKQELYPLTLIQCKNCQHLQLKEIVNPNKLFKHYVYVSGTSDVFVKHFADYALSISKYFNPNDLVIDIGSNDGTLLSCIKSVDPKVRVLGIDPAEEIAAEVNKQNLTTICDYFNQKTMEHIKDKYGLAKIITCNNMFAHAEDLLAIIQDVKSLLTDDGYFIFEVSYAMNMLKNFYFDLVYHEHIHFHTLTALSSFLEYYGLPIVKVEEVNTHGGSIRVYCQKSCNQIDSKYLELLNYEKENLLNYIENFQNKVISFKNTFKNKINELHLLNKKIVGFGAPAKLTTLMYHSELTNQISYIIDDSDWKQNLYTPGLNIPVVSSDILNNEVPDYIIIFAWNFADSIINKNIKYLENGGTFIVPLPEYKEITYASIAQ